MISGIAWILLALLAGGVAGIVTAFWYVEGLESRIAWLERHDKARAPKPTQDARDDDEWNWPGQEF